MSKNDYENYQVMYCLADAKQQYPNEPVIIVKDTSVCNADPLTIANIVRASLNGPPFDLCYLCKWLDQCQLYTDKRQIPDKSTVIAKTQSPHGVQCILFSVSGRDTVLGLKPMKNGNFFKLSPGYSLGKQLNEDIFEGGINAIVIVPNLIEFDLRAAVTNDDYLKLSECAAVTSTQAQSDTSSYIWFFVIVIFVAILIWAAINFASRP
jgi:hypothetical protein